MYTKKNGRVTFKSNRRSNFKRSNNFINSKGRNKGNVTQQYNKFLKLAKDSFASGDRIQAEYYYQFTDHYYRLMVELGINNEENENSTETKVADVDTNVENASNEMKENVDDKKNIEYESSEKSEQSMESVPFMSKPVKKKKVRSSK